MSFDDDLAAGARNLLVNCAEVSAGDRVLILHEDPSLGWYDLDAPKAVARQSEALGANTTMIEVGGPANTRDQGLAREIAARNIIVFFSRIGDQDRFADPTPGRIHVMCYAQNAAMLASSYGRTDHRAMLALKTAVNDIVLDAASIRITCAAGTDVSRDLGGSVNQPREDVSVRRFPMGVPQPVDAGAFEGQVVLANYLTPTGSKVYDPAFLKIDTPSLANIAGGRIVSFDGPPEMIAGIRRHYDGTARQLDIEPDVVHSWHAGIHPGCVYDHPAGDNPDRWSNTAFTNPRILHFHTCGAYPPGEICWMVIDPTVEVGGTALWKNGRLRLDAFPQTRQCVDDWPELVALFEQPSDRIGL